MAQLSRGIGRVNQRERERESETVSERTVAHFESRWAIWRNKWTKCIVSQSWISDSFDFPLIDQSGWSSVKPMEQVLWDEISCGFGSNIQYMRAGLHTNHMRRQSASILQMLSSHVIWIHISSRDSHQPSKQRHTRNEFHYVDHNNGHITVEWAYPHTNLHKPLHLVWKIADEILQ